MSVCTLHRTFDPPPVAAQAARFDPFARPHRRLRLDLCGLIVRLSCAEAMEGRAMAGLLTDLRAQLGACRAQLAAERPVHEALRAYAPEAVEELEAYHAYQTQGLETLEALMAEGAPLQALCLTYTRFVAGALAHMAHAELETLPILHALFTDGELAAIAEPAREAA